MNNVKTNYHSQQCPTESPLSLFKKQIFMFEVNFSRIQWWYRITSFRLLQETWTVTLLRKIYTNWHTEYIQHNADWKYTFDTTDWKYTNTLRNSPWNSDSRHKAVLDVLGGPWNRFWNDDDEQKYSVLVIIMVHSGNENVLESWYLTQSCFFSSVWSRSWVSHVWLQTGVASNSAKF